MADHTATKTAELGALDGRIAPSDELSIPVTDEGLLRGDGVFEVIRVYDGPPSRSTSTSTGSSARAPTCACRGPAGGARERDPRAARRARRRRVRRVLRIVVTRGGRRLLLTEPLPRPAARRAARHRHLRAHARARRHQVALLCAANMLARGLRRSAASTRRCSSPRTGACSRRRPRRSSGSTGRRALHAAARRAHPRLDHPRR